jgi:RNA polymerase sigma-70 factor (ECF subfamily)
MPVDLRIPFALRFVDGMELRDVAEACDCSLATVKRRLASAEKRFLALANRDPALAAAVARSVRWGTP